MSSPVTAALHLTGVWSSLAKVCTWRVDNCPTTTPVSATLGANSNLCMDSYNDAGGRIPRVLGLSETLNQNKKPKSSESSAGPCEDVNVSVTGHTDHRCQCHTALLMSVSHGGAGEDLTKPPELRDRVEATPGYSPLVIADRETRLQLPPHLQCSSFVCSSAS